MSARRSLLFVPGARPDRFDKAQASGADMVCVDLEDAVAPDGKDAAREAALAWLVEAASATGPERVVRLLPPLIIDEDQAGQIVNAVCDSIEAID